MAVLAGGRRGLARQIIPIAERRNAHAAARPLEEESTAGPSNYRRSGPEIGSDRKGKGRARDQTQGTEYRYPAKGRMGGEPDPFEVMAIDRSASQSEVKKQCTSPPQPLEYNSQKST